MMPVDLTALLKEWGVTITFLSIAATALLVIFTLSFREFASWFVRVNKILKNQDDILRKLDKLESLVERVEFEKSPEIKLMAPTTATHSLPANDLLASLPFTTQTTANVTSLSFAPAKKILMGPTKLTATSPEKESALESAPLKTQERFQLHS